MSRGNRLIKALLKVLDLLFNRWNNGPFSFTLYNLFFRVCNESDTGQGLLRPRTTAIVLSGHIYMTVMAVKPRFHRAEEELRRTASRADPCTSHVMLNGV